MKKFRSKDHIDFERPFGIIKQTENCGVHYPEHMHEFIEIVYVKEGKSTHFADGSSFEVNSGDILFIDYNQSHSFHVHSDKLQFFNLLVKPEYISRTLSNAENIYDIFSFFILDKYFESGRNRVSLIHFSGTDKLELDVLAERMNDEWEAKLPGYELALEGYMRLIFSKVIRVLRQSSTHNFFNAIIPGLLEYIDVNFTGKLTLNVLAEKCFYNPAYLGRVFKKTFNMTFHEYINEKRTAYAKKLLLETDDSISSIASAVGYNDEKQFFRVFREKEGCTPKQFREK